MIYCFFFLLSSNDSNETNLFQFVSFVSLDDDLFLRLLFFLLSSNDSNETNLSQFVSLVSFDENLVAHSGARTWCHALPWWALCCSLSSRTAAASKQKYLDYDMCSRRWSRTTARPCRARDGVFSYLSLQHFTSSINLTLT